MALRAPCKTCPWRVDQDATVIPNFHLALAERLIATTGDEFGAPQFACHQSQAGKEVVCAGWLARYGWDNVGVRIGLITGKYTPDQLQPGDDWPEIHETFEDVIEKLRSTASQEDEEEECVFCGERRGPHEFKDGLRCVYCAEEQDREDEEGC